MSVGLCGNVVWRDDFDEDFLEVVLGVLVAEFGERTFGEKLARLDDADGVAELFDFTHDVCGEDDRFAVVAAFADERSEEHTSELQSPCNLVCRLLLEKKNRRHCRRSLYKWPYYLSSRTANTRLYHPCHSA